MRLNGECNELKLLAACKSENILLQGPTRIPCIRDGKGDSSVNSLNDVLVVTLSKQTVLKPDRPMTRGEMQSTACATELGSTSCISVLCAVKVLVIRYSDIGSRGHLSRFMDAL
jgi:hypothetical protein